MIAYGKIKKIVHTDINMKKAPVSPGAVSLSKNPETGSRIGVKIF